MDKRRVPQRSCSKDSGCAQYSYKLLKDRLSCEMSCTSHFLLSWKYPKDRLSSVEVFCHFCTWELEQEIYSSKAIITDSQ